MKLERIPCKYLNRAQNVFVSNSYIIGCTGQKAVILNRQLEFVHIVQGLEYVYCAQMSPDEKSLLLISNGNKFYVVDMETFSTIRITVKSPFNRNLEGRGCWSFDGKSILIPVQHNRTGKSTLRCYSLETLQEFQEFLPEKYYLAGISQTDTPGTYFLTGYNRNDNNQRYLIFFDGISFRETPLNDTQMIILSADADIQHNIITIYTPNGCQQFTLDGTPLSKIAHPAPTMQSLSFSDIFTSWFHNEPDLLSDLTTLSTSLGLDNVFATDSINKYEVSQCGNYYYLASQSGFYLLDAKTHAVLAVIKEEFGVQNFEELSPRVLAMATWHGIRIYKIIDT